MRIGVDMLGIQAVGPGGAGRDHGASRYARLLFDCFILKSADRGHEVVLYGYNALPRDAIPRSAWATARFIPLDFGRPAGEMTPGERLERRVQANPDRLDWLVVIDPLGPGHAFAPPARPLPAGPESPRLRIAAIVPDLTRFELPERDLDDPSEAARSTGRSNV